MSLINDVLRDLQAREDMAPPLLAGLRPAAERRGAYGLGSAAWPFAAVTMVLLGSWIWGPAQDGDAQRTDRVSAAARFTTIDIPLPPAARTQADHEAEDHPIDEIAVRDVGAPPAPVAAENLPHSDGPVAPPGNPAERLEAPPGRDVRISASVNPSATGQALQSGIAALRGADPAAAEAHFRQAAAAEPLNADARRYLYVALNQQGKTEAADTVAREALTLPEASAVFAKLHAGALSQRGEAAAAVEILQAHRPIEALDIEYEALLAALLQQVGDHREAETVYERLLTVDPNTGDWWVGLGIARENLGDAAGARAAYARAQDRDIMNAALSAYAAERVAALEISH